MNCSDPFDSSERHVARRENGATLDHGPHQEVEPSSKMRDRTTLLLLATSFRIPRTFDFSFIRTPENVPICYTEHLDEVITGETKPPTGTLHSEHEPVLCVDEAAEPMPGTAVS